MKQLEISKLMDDYVDNEFCPEEGSAVSAEAVKARVLAQAAPLGKGRMPRKKKLLLAAALAAVMVVLVGAGIPQRIYQLAAGTVGFSGDRDSKTISYQYQDGSRLMELEDGRLYFVLNGERTDVTDLIDRETPYLYNGNDPEHGLTYYAILGGTPERYGWFQWIAVPDPFTPDDAPAADGDGTVYTYEFSFLVQDDGEPYRVGSAGAGNPVWQMLDDFNGISAEDLQWLRAGVDELEIPFIDSTNETVTTIQEK